ncbi:MAG: hypothetical protein IKC69_06085 [Clostridia bacterium]|nr:hypothetical protein [Clostridia bacterium]
MKQMLKKLVFIGLSLSLLSSLAACGSEKENPASTAPEAETVTATKAESDTVAEDNAEESEEFYGEILEKIELRYGYADLAPTPSSEAHRSTVIRSKEDLAPFLPYLDGLDPADAERFSESENDFCVVLQLRAPTVRTMFEPASVYREQGFIEISISEFIDSDETVSQPLYTYLLLYIPAEYYHGEAVNISFLFE